MNTNDFELRLQQAKGAIVRLREAIARVIVGQSDVVNQVMWGLAAGGHVLLEGAPGLGKTLLVRTLAQCLDLRFSRIQFTPDLMPSDVIGTNVLVMDAAQRAAGSMFQVQKGPIFGQVVLADEINRATPKTQSALLEAMAEHAVTIAGQRHALEEPFFVLATENPIEMEGTYPLPEAQLDRFLLEVHVEYPSAQEEREIARRTTGVQASHVPRVLGADEVRALQALVPRIPVTDAAVELAVALGRATRPHDPKAPREARELVRFGSGPRGPQALVLASKARAALRGEAAADLEDVKALVLPVLRHRLVLSYRAEAEGVSSLDVLERVVASVG
jgi:MoxR-like ATPase